MEKKKMENTYIEKNGKLNPYTYTLHRYSDKYMFCACNAMKLTKQETSNQIKSYKQQITAAAEQNHCSMYRPQERDKQIKKDEK